MNNNSESNKDEKDNKQVKAKLSKITPLQHNFKLFNGFLFSKQTSYGKAFVFLTISFLHIYSSQLTFFYDYIKTKYPNINNTYINTFMSTIKYIDAKGMLSFNSALLYFLFSLAMLFTLGNFLLYILILFLISYNDDPKFEPSKLFYGKIYVFLSQYLLWIAFYPSTLILISFVQCDQNIFENCNFDSSRILVMFFAIIGLLCGFAHIIILSLFFQNQAYNRKDSFNCENSLFIAIINIYKMIYALLICLRQVYLYRIQCYSPNSSLYFWLFQIFTFIFQLYFILAAIFGSGFLAFQTSSVRKLFVIFSIGSLSLNSAIIIDETLRSIAYDNSIDNILLYIFMLVCYFEYIFLNVSGRYALKASQNIQIQRKSGFQLKKQIFMLQTIFEQSLNQIDQDVFFKGLMQQIQNLQISKRHLESECQNIVYSGMAKCFCKNRLVFDSKKFKDATLNKWITNKSIFLKFLIKSWIETYLHYHPNDLDFKLLYAEFLFNKFRNHQVPLKIISELEQNFMFILHRYRAFQLRSQITKFIQDKNKDSYKGRLEIEIALYVEEQISLIKTNIIKITNYNCLFWSSLQKNIIDLDEINILLTKQFLDIENTKKLWMKINFYLDYKKKWKFYFAWQAIIFTQILRFTLFILNKKVQNRVLENFQGYNLTENDIFSEEIQDHDQEADFVSVDSKESDISERIEIKSKKLIFDKQSCIIQTTDDNDGLIVEVNKQFTKVFGYSKQETVNMLTINILMPDIFSKYHPSIIEDYRITGKSTSLYSQRKIFCLHQNGSIFAAYKFLKHFINIQGQARFVVLIRPIEKNREKKDDLILFDNNWQISGLTQNLITQLQLDQSIFAKQKSSNLLICLLLFAPKLIQYSKIAKFLKEEDLFLLGLTHNKAKKEKNVTSEISPQIESSKPQINIVKNTSKNQLLIPQNSFGPSFSLLSEVEIQSNSHVLFQQESIEKEQEQDPSQCDQNELQEYKKEIEFMKGNLVTPEELLMKATQKLDREIKENFFEEIQRQPSHQESSDESLDIMNIDEIKKIQSKARNAYRYMEERLENGEVISFHLKIPDNFVEICKFYDSHKQKLYEIKVTEEEIQYLE